MRSEIECLKGKLNDKVTDNGESLSYNDEEMKMLNFNKDNRDDNNVTNKEVPCSCGRSEDDNQMKQI